jgi:hypothetical protein
VRSLGYVSDELYVGLADVLLEFESPQGIWQARSTASGAVQVDLPDGAYRVTLHRRGFGSKRIHIECPSTESFHFRLLSDCLLGFAWPKWVQTGECSQFRVHSVEAYEVELWRYGASKRLVSRLGWHDEHGPRAMMQTVPDGDFTRTGARWNGEGYASVVPPPAVAPDHSGLYYFHVRTASGAFFSFPWIVAPRRPRAAMAVLASNITWNAYNAFGGRSNYINADELPTRPVVNARQELTRYVVADHATWGAGRYAPLSFERPEPINAIDENEAPGDPIQGRSSCHVAPAEWRLLAWLEQQGYAYDYYAETQLHEGLLDLSKYRVLILSTHPEYWTRTMVERVKGWVDSEGGRLVYLGGNGLNCEVEMHGGDAMTVKNGAIRGLWEHQIGAESRMALSYVSEASLLGVVFTPTGVMTAAPYRVFEPVPWLFRGTGLRKGDLFGRHSLHRRCPGGASGHETDKISPSSPPGVVLAAKGTNPNDGGAEMVFYSTPSGGRVFSAGSICYPSSLLVDAAVSRITANVLDAFLQ